MHQIHFYRDKSGKQPVLDYLQSLKDKGDKNSRIKLNKIGDYIELLKQEGTAIGEPYVKHLEGKIWELRPIKDRVLFVAWHNGSYVLLHAFTKKTQKTPKKELKRAREAYKDIMERGISDEE